MYVDIQKYRERSLIENIQDIQIKTIFLYQDSKNMPDSLLKELTYSLNDMYAYLYDGIVNTSNYERTTKILEHLTNYMKERLIDTYNTIDDYNLPSNIIQLKHICNMVEDKLLAKNSEGLYEKEISFIKSYKLYLLNLAYFLSDLLT
jgi:hypothetical protein